MSILQQLIAGLRGSDGGFPLLKLGLEFPSVL